MKAVLLAIALVAPAEAQPRPCLTTAEAEALVAIALPDVMRQTGVRCAAKLPATSLLRRPNSELLRRHDAAAAAAWPAARAAMIRLSDPMVNTLLQSDFARTVIATVAAPLIVGRIATTDCATIERMVTLLEPLPPRNVAGLVVAGLDRARQARPAAGASNPVASLPLCLAEAR